MSRYLWHAQDPAPSRPCRQHGIVLQRRLADVDRVGGALHALKLQSAHRVPCQSFSFNIQCHITSARESPWETLRSSERCYFALVRIKASTKRQPRRSCHILPFQPILWNRDFPSEPSTTAENSPQSISEGGRIWQVCKSLRERSEAAEQNSHHVKQACIHNIT